jgi:transcriptional regulator with XRE-family HTH domain
LADLFLFLTAGKPLQIKMKFISHILNTTGMSQDLLAGYTGISRQSLMKAAKGFISLNTSAMIKLSRLQLAIENSVIPEQELAFSKMKNEYEATKEMTCRYRALVLQKKLDSYEAYQKKYRQFLCALDFFEPADEQEKLWIQRTKTLIIKKLETCGVATCMRLRKQVYLLEAEADYISRLVNEQHPDYEKP